MFCSALSQRGGLWKGFWGLGVFPTIPMSHAHLAHWTVPSNRTLLGCLWCGNRVRVDAIVVARHNIAICGLPRAIWGVRTNTWHIWRGIAQTVEHHRKAGAWLELKPFGVRSHR